MILILPDIRSIHNVGSIFRTADALGISKIYLTGYTPSPIDRYGRMVKAFSKVALGAEKSVQWEKNQNIVDLINRYRKDGFQIFAIEQRSDSIAYYDAKIQELKKIVLILGNEVDGLPDKILDMCDGILEIPMNGQKESLNVSVSFGIVAFGIKYLSSKK